MMRTAVMLPAVRHRTSIMLASRAGLGLQCTLPMNTTQILMHHEPDADTDATPPPILDAENDSKASGTAGSTVTAASAPERRRQAGVCGRCYRHMPHQFRILKSQGPTRRSARPISAKLQVTVPRSPAGGNSKWTRR